MQPPADVRITSEAHFALFAGCGGIDRDTEAGTKRSSIAGCCIPPALFDDPREFVSEDERGRH